MEGRRGGEREEGKGREGVGSNLRFSPSPTLAGDTPVQVSGQSHGKGALAHAHVRTHIHTYAHVRTRTGGDTWRRRRACSVVGGGRGSAGLGCPLRHHPWLEQIPPTPCQTSGFMCHEGHITSPGTAGMGEEGDGGVGREGKREAARRQFRTVRVYR